MVASAKQNLRAAGARTRVRTVVADAGYWSKDNVTTSGVEALIAPGKTHNLDQQIRAEVPGEQSIDQGPCHRGGRREVPR